MAGEPCHLAPTPLAPAQLAQARAETAAAEALWEQQPDLPGYKNPALWELRGPIE
jgi:hypothetical protein